MSLLRKKFPIHPHHPERNCWGCDRYCAAQAMLCGNGSERTQHPSELWGPDWANEADGADGANAPTPLPRAATASAAPPLNAPPAP